MTIDAELKHSYAPADSFDGGDLDCGGGLLLLIRKHIDPIAIGDLLEIRSTESSVAEDLPAWCRMTGNELVSTRQAGRTHSFLVSKGRFNPEMASNRTRRTIRNSRPSESTGIEIPPLAAMGIGSWPRPDWMLSALRDYLEGRLPEIAFQAIADQACLLAIQAQEQAGADVITDGEQRRDSYASFVGGRLDNCQLIPLIDLTSYVDHPEEFQKELLSLDVEPSKVRHPAVFGRITRTRPIVAHELAFARTKTQRPIKVALPGPYVLTRTMWLECVSDRAYETREALAADLIQAMRLEIQDLLDQGASLIQLDEPILTEVVHGRMPGSTGRSFMCGALGDKLETGAELEFAESLIQAVAKGFPPNRLALHVCRGNWSCDERNALAGDYRPLIPLLSRLPMQTLFLELCTERAGEGEELGLLPEDKRIGVGVINQKTPRVESVEEIIAKAEKMITRFGPHRILLNPDCGFATFADQPICSHDIAKGKLAAIAEASRRLRTRYHLDSSD